VKYTRDPTESLSAGTVVDGRFRLSGLRIRNAFRMSATFIIEGL
jgi:hypothetical protein